MSMLQVQLAHVIAFSAHCEARQDLGKNCDATITMQQVLLIGHIVHSNRVQACTIGCISRAGVTTWLTQEHKRRQ